jgi:hypothetical protein
MYVLKRLSKVAHKEYILCRKMSKLVSQLDRMKLYIVNLKLITNIEITYQRLSKMHSDNKFVDI